ncbi:MAG: hypothetical protein AB7E49_06810 [Campylobacterales bacterium]
MNGSMLSLYGEQAKNEELFKKKVEEVLRAYRHSWDVIAELAQNSIDAILVEKKNRGEGYHPFMELTINPSTIIFKDNGCGIDHNKIGHVLIPDISLKKLGENYGYKGYGLTFIAFISSKIKIITVHNKKKSTIEYRDLFQWICGEVDAKVLMPLDGGPKIEDTNEQNGTFIEVKLAIGEYESKFDGLASFDDIFKWMLDIDKLKYILRTKTFVGNVNTLFDNKAKIHPDIKIYVNYVHNQERHEIENKYLTPLESQFLGAGQVFEINKYKKIYYDGQSSDSQKRFRGLYTTFLGQEVGVMKKFEFDVFVLVCGKRAMTKLAEEHGFIDHENQMSMKEGTGIFLAINGMPTGIKLDKWEQKGSFWLRYFVIVNVNNMEIGGQLDPGRKGITNYYADLIAKKVEALISGHKFEKNDTLKTYAKFLAETSVSDSDDLDDEDDYVYESRQIVERWRRGEVLNPLLTSIKYTPLDENGVIAIFYELIAQKKLIGYRTLYISQSAAYDVAFDYVIKRGESQYDAHSNPFGIGLKYKEQDITLTYDNKERYLIGEFKLKVQDIIKDFESGVKNPDHIKLIIAWDFDQRIIEDRAAKIDPVSPNMRKYFGVTHILTYQHKEVHCIVLNELFKRFS